MKKLAATPCPRSAHHLERHHRGPLAAAGRCGESGDRGDRQPQQTGGRRGGLARIMGTEPWLPSGAALAASLDGAPPQEANVCVKIDQRSGLLNQATEMNLKPGGRVGVRAKTRMGSDNQGRRNDEISAGAETDRRTRTMTKQARCDPFHSSG